MEKKVYKKGRLTVEMDPNDPETPVMIYIRGRYGSVSASATFECGFMEECLFDPHTCTDIALTKTEVEWLAGMKDEADDFYGKYRVVD